jgi:hypothetical protein
MKVKQKIGVTAERAIAAIGLCIKIVKAKFHIGKFLFLSCYGAKSKDVQILLEVTFQKV